MKITLATVLAALPLDRRSRRAMDETLADWALEREHARTAFGHVCVCARGLAGVTRAFVYSIADEITRIPGGWITSRVVLLMAAPAVLLAATGWGHVSPWRGVPEWSERLQLATLALPQAAAALLPLALFAVTAWRTRRRSLPTLGLSAAVMAGVLAVGAWGLPAASRQFHQVAYAPQTNVTPAEADGRLRVGPPDLMPLDLIGSAVQRPFGPSMAVLLFRSGLAFLCASFVVLGSAAGRLDRRRRRACVVLVTAAYAAGIALLPSEWELGGHAPAPVGLIPWIGSGLAITYSITLGWKRQREGDLR